MKLTSKKSVCDWQSVLRYYRLGGHFGRPVSASSQTSDSAPLTAWSFTLKHLKYLNLS